MRRLFYVLALLAGPAAAVDLVLDLQSGADHHIPIASVTIDPANGDIIVDPLPNAGTAGDGWCPAGSQTLAGAPAINLAANASKAIIAETGERDATLSWSSPLASACVASAIPESPAWNGTLETHGQRTIRIQRTTVFQIQCTSANGKTTTVARTVPVAAPGSACLGHVAPKGLVRQPLMINAPQYRDNREFEPGQPLDLTHLNPMLGRDFGRSEERAQIAITKGRYVAIQFNVGDLRDETTGAFTWTSAAGDSAPLVVQISPCPGDFEFVLDPRCKAYGADGELQWSVGQQSMAGACPLNPKTTYYVNAVFAAAAWDYATSSCSGSACDWSVGTVLGD